MTHLTAVPVMAQKGRRSTTLRPRLEAPRARAESEARNKGYIGYRALPRYPIYPFLVFTCNARTHTHKTQPGTRVISGTTQVWP